MFGTRRLALLSIVGMIAAPIFAKCPPASDPTAVVRGALAKRLDRHVREGTELEFSGSVLVAQGGEIVLHRGYGWANRKGCIPISATTAFWIGSLTKQFTAAAILGLEQRGKLKLGDPLGKYLDNLPPDKQALTVHQLLTHTSGLGQRYAADGVADRAKAIRALTRAPLESEPGHTYSYSNDGYNLLAILVSVVSGKPFDAYLQEQLFRPAGLEHTTTSGVARKGLVVAERGPGATRRGDPQRWADDWGFRGATGVITTTADLYRWYGALRAGAVLDDGRLKLLWSRHVQKREGLYYAYGWQIADTSSGELIVHSGDDTVISHDATLRYYVERDLLVIITANAGYHDGNGVGQLLGRELAGLALK